VVVSDLRLRAGRDGLQAIGVLCEHRGTALLVTGDSVPSEASEPSSNGPRKRPGSGVKTPATMQPPM
jgi:hypothetical protein